MLGECLLYLVTVVLASQGLDRRNDDAVLQWIDNVGVKSDGQISAGTVLAKSCDGGAGEVGLDKRDDDDVSQGFKPSV